ncbi:MAG: TIGR00725 family protein [Anaerolineales bacterium]|jgi:uncharacterized protein (TIGR00725 family)
MKRIVSIIGQSDSTAEQDAQAYELGRLISKSGYAIVCGGKGGVMEAVARGAHEEGGLCIGILPGNDPDAGNRYLTLAIPTGLGHARNLLVARAGEVVVALGGAYGTLSEIAFALTMGKVVIGIDTWSAASHSGISAEVIAVESPGEAMALIKKTLSN